MQLGIENSSRRSFLTATGVTILGTALIGTDGTNESSQGRQTAAPILAKQDLLAPPDEVYVSWHVQPTTAPLLSHLVESLDGINVQDALVGGFIGRHGDHAPRYIETAAIPAELPGGTELAIREADVWVASTHGRSVEGTTVGRESFAWHATDGEWAEAVRLERVGDWLLLTSAGGRARAHLTPVDAVAHYASLLAKRAEGVELTSSTSEQ